MLQAGFCNLSYSFIKTSFSLFNNIILIVCFNLAEHRFYLYNRIYNPGDAEDRKTEAL